MKYGVWNVSVPAPEAVNALVSGGYSPLCAMVLASRGMNSVKEANEYLDCNGILPSPLAMTDMGKAVDRVRLAMCAGEKIAIFGDYDVDGITSTCLLTDYLRRAGADVVSYIPGRLEEGYGLNPIAIRSLHGQGVRLIVTVDCGITAVEEAALCSSLGIDLVITDHHECKETLPDAVAVVDPHRPDGGYPHKMLSGVGVAFKLAAALAGSQEEILRSYADLVCLGTVADVMELQGENRVFVARGLEMLRTAPRPGLAALMAECNCVNAQISASTIGFMLAPRINAAGRMGQIDLAVDLILTEDYAKACILAKSLCDLNRKRQEVESVIFSQAVSMLPAGGPPDAIVLADDTWHQGVVGIVASRMAEEYCCPTFLICLDGAHGKASSRSYGGFNLFSSLSSLSELLESFGGHALAAGFTIARDKIADFRREICAMAADYYTDGVPRTLLDIDCEIPAQMLSVRAIDSLSALEPCGNGCPKPVVMMRNLRIDRIGMVGGAKHMRLTLSAGTQSLAGIFFSQTPESASVCIGDLVDVAFYPQVNEYKGSRSVQLNIIDIRPSCQVPCSAEDDGYGSIARGTLSAREASVLLPDRATLGRVWRYLVSCNGPIQEEPVCLCRKIVRATGQSLSLGQMLVCLDIFADVGLLRLHRYHKYMTVELLGSQGKADLNTSRTMKILLAAKES